MEKNFLDSLNDWGSVLTDTYERSSNNIELANISFDNVVNATIDNGDAIKTIYFKELTAQLKLTPDDVVTDIQEYGEFKRVEAAINNTVDLNLLYIDKGGNKSSEVITTNRRELLFTLMKSDLGYIFLYHPLLNLDINETNYSSLRLRGQIKYMIGKKPTTNLTHENIVVNINDDVLKLISNVILENAGDDKELVDAWSKLKQNIIMNNNKVI